MKQAPFRAFAMLALACCLASLNAHAAGASAPARPAQPSPAQAARQRTDTVEQRIATLHKELQITAAESTVWHSFAQTIRDNAGRMERAFHARARKLPTMNAEDAMESYAKLAQLHANNMRALSAAFGRLYAVLTPTQKRIADRLFRNPHPRHRR